MSRVFISCSYRDRGTGRLGHDLVRGMGLDVDNDRGDSSDPDWWNEVVRRIERSDVFVALASPSYASSKACRYAADHAEALDLPVLRLDLGETDLEGCHPVVAEAEAVPFDPDDMESVDLLASALEEALAEPEEPVPESGPELDRSLAQRPTRGRLGTLLALVPSLAAVAAFLLVLRLVGSDIAEEPDRPPATGGVASEPGSAELQGPTILLATLSAAEQRSPGFALPASSCVVEDAASVSCGEPAPGVESVAVWHYPGRQQLYAVYADELRARGGDPVPENTAAARWRRRTARWPGTSMAGTTATMGWPSRCSAAWIRSPRWRGASSAPCRRT